TSEVGPLPLRRGHRPVHQVELAQSVHERGPMARALRGTDLEGASMAEVDGLGVGHDVGPVDGLVAVAQVHDVLLAGRRRAGLALSASHCSSAESAVSWPMTFSKFVWVCAGMSSAAERWWFTDLATATSCSCSWWVVSRGSRPVTSLSTAIGTSFSSESASG